jgi:hypothetical protein
MDPEDNDQLSESQVADEQNDCGYDRTFETDEDCEEFEREMLFNDQCDEQEAEREGYLIDGVGFAREGSALRAETPRNPRIYSCPNCDAPNVLTRFDVARGYQCDTCADAAERGGW